MTAKKQVLNNYHCMSR